jgi:hypothetical protein
MDPQTLGKEAAVEILEAIVAAIPLRMSGVVGYRRRVGFVSLLWGHSQPGDRSVLLDMVQVPRVLYG